MLKGIAEWVARKLVVAKIEQLEERVLVVLADAWRNDQREPTVKTDVRFTRVLLSAGELVVVTGTDDEIAAAAAHLSSRTKACVSVAVIVAIHHRRGCSDRRDGGVETVGN